MRAGGTWREAWAEGEVQGTPIDIPGSWNFVSAIAMGKSVAMAS
jgi:hypothetical protein